MSKEPENLILEQVPDNGVREILYLLHDRDVPIYYSRNRKIPDRDNVYRFPEITVLVTPNREQEQYIEGRVLNLYDELSPDLNDFAEEVFACNSLVGAVRVFKELLTQHDAAETAEYLKDRLGRGTLHNYIELESKASYENRNEMIETFAFYLKGEFKSYGCTVVRGDNCYNLLYDESSDYNAALGYFRENLHVADRPLLDCLTGRDNQM